MRINIITTIDYPLKNEDKITQDEINEIYVEFHKVIKNSHESKDLTDFMFVNSDTNTEIEYEVDE